MKRFGKFFGRLLLLVVLGTLLGAYSANAWAENSEAEKARVVLEKAKAAYDEARAQADFDKARARAEFDAARAKAKFEAAKKALDDLGKSAPADEKKPLGKDKASGKNKASDKDKAGEPEAKAAGESIDGKALLGKDAPLPPDLKVEELSGPVAKIRIEGGIFLGTADYLRDAIGRAEQEGFVCLLVELDTPGGALDETQEMVKAMLGAEVPVLVFVAPKGAQAASAGTFITMAGHVAVMAPGTRIGAAHVVMMSMIPSGVGGGDESAEEKRKRGDQQAIMNEKVTNDTVAFIQSIAKERGRNATWAEKAVRESVSITADEALAEDVIDLVAENESDLLEQLDGRVVQLSKKRAVRLKTKGAEIRPFEKSLKQRLLGGLAHPNLLFILFLLGLGGIAMEFYHPGMIVPGAVGAICLLLALISMQLLPVSWGGLLLVLAGLGLIIGEVYVTSYGLMGAGGAILMVLGGIMLIDPASQPHYMDPNLKVDWSVLIPTVLVLVGSFLFVGYMVVRNQRKKIRTGAEGLEAELGRVRSEVTPEGGRIFVRGEIWSARCKEGSIPKGGQVEVLKLEEGLSLLVKATGPDNEKANEKDKE